jgi:hypothetical protein
MARFTQGGSSNNGGAALNYVQVAGTPQTISTAPNAIVDLDITTTGAPVQISVTGEGANASAGSWLRLNLFRDNIEIGNAIQMESSAASENVPFAINFIDDVAAGTYNYSARVTTITGGNWVFGEAAGPVINAVELTGFKGDRGLRGLTGDAGAGGADALWNYVGEYSGGSSYAVGDVVTFEGQLWYRANANGGNVGDTPSEGFIWDLLAAKGEDGADGADGSGGLVYLGNYISGNGYVADLAVVRGSDNNLYIAKDSGGLQDPVGNTAQWDIFSTNAGGTADIADFVFEAIQVDDWTESFMTVANHDMNIRTTTAEPGDDGDIEINSADDLRLISYDELDIDSGSSISITADTYVNIRSNDSGDSEVWSFQTDGTLETPGSIYLNQNALVSATSEIRNETEAITQVFSDSAAMPGTTITTVISVPADEVSLLIEGYTYETDSMSVTLADTTVIEITTINSGTQSGYEGQIVNFNFAEELTLDPTNVFPFTFNGLRTYSNEVNTLTLAPYDTNGEPLPIEWQFGSDGILNTPSGSPKILNQAVPGDITISAYNGLNLSFANVEGAGLKFPDNTVQTTAYTGGAGGDLVVPTAIKDSEDDDFITFTRTNTNTARIDAPQDDLSLRSARDITLFPGTDGEGNVYIGWGDANLTPDATNRVATIGDINSANTGDITFVDNTISSDTGDDIVIENKDDDGIVKARITLDQSNEQVLIQAIASDSEWFNDTQWSTAAWSGSVVSITNSTDIINFFDNVAGETTRVSINNGGLLTYEGASFGGGNITINVGGTPPDGQDPLTVTEIRFYYALVSEINIDHDDSEFNIISRGMSMTIDSSGDLDLKARDEDLHLYANDDVRFTTNWDNNGTEYSWRMSESGKFELPGDGYIENPVNSSGDGSAYDTIKIVPDADLIEQQYHEDQYLIIDPTQPNHIHIRAGGVQDSSTADLFLGAERTGIKVSDSTGDVTIKSKNPDTTNIYENGGGFEPTVLAIVGDLSYIQPYANFSVDVDGTLYQIDAVSYNSGTNVTQITATPATFITGMSYMIHESNGENYWTFTDNGYIDGPAMGSLFVSGIMNANGDLYVQSSNDNVSVTSGASINLNANNAVRVTTNGGDSAWDFSIDGKLYGPGEDGSLILGGEILTTDINMSIRSTQQSVVLNGALGEFLGSSDDANSQIATIGDVTTAVGVGGNGEVTRWTPSFTATGLTFTGSGATHPAYNSYYVKNGRMVSFNIEVNLSTVTNFGTGQYKLELPFTPQFGFNHFSGWVWADPNIDPDTGTGHTILNADTAGVTDVLDLHYLKQSGGANSPIREALFLQGAPVTLTTISKIYINGTYITAE